MLKIFKPHPEIPNHFVLEDGYYFVTSDVDRENFKWSRLIRDNYVPGYGFLGHHGTERIDFRVFKQTSEYAPLIPIDPVKVAEQLQEIMVEGTETILHYYDKGYVMSLVTGIDPAMLSQLSESYRRLYYEYT